LEKDAYYFPHFCNAKSDRKILRVRKELGLEGYGIFFMLLETLREQADLKYPMCDIDLLSDEFGTSEQKVRTVISNYDLFTIEESGKFFSPRLLLYLEPYFSMKEQRKLAGKKSAEKRALKALETQEIQRSFNDRSTTVQQSKVKESKRNESKTNIYTLNEMKLPINQNTHENLIAKYDEQVVKDYYERILDYSNSQGKKYKDFSATARNWIKRDIEQGKGPKPLPPKKKTCPACGSLVPSTGCNVCLLEVSDWETADLEHHRAIARKKGIEC
jgi:hypothetical protein